MQDFLSVLAVDLAEEIFSPGVFLISLQRLSERVVFAKLLFKRWSRVFDVLAKCCQGIDALLPVSVMCTERRLKSVTFGKPTNTLAFKSASLICRAILS